MYHLTKPQKLIYDMEKYAGGSISNVCGSIVIKGEKDVSVLTNAVKELYHLNDALRIRITETDGVPFQTVSDYKEQQINVLHFTDKEELNYYAEKYAKEPIDFYGALCEINVVLLNGGYGLLVKLHHIISDAWTLSLIGTQFNALANGEIPEAYSYIDYIPAEQEYFNGKRYPKDKEYYIEQYKKCDDITYIRDKQVKSYVSNRKHFLIDEEKTAKIQNYANEHKTSVYMLLMTALGTYINRIKMNQEKFYIGTAILNRTNTQEKNTMGMFINTAPVLIELDNEKTFSENLRTISKTLFSIIKHQKFNYGEVLETLRHEFDFTGNLYDVMLSYQNAKFTGIDTDFESVWYCNGMQTESLQMHINDRDSEGILKIHYDYQTEKFTDEEIERMHEHIFNLLFDAINEDKKITELAILSNKEKTTLLCDFNDTKADYPKDKCVHQLFEEQVSKTPDKTAVIACDKTLTYEELNKLSNRIANGLIRNGIKPNDTVAFSMSRNSLMIATMFGVLKTGAAYMPLDPNYPQDRIDFMVKDSNSKLLITDRNIEEYLSFEESTPINNISSDDNFCILHTSGSTGTPKCAAIKHKNMVNFIYSNQFLLSNIDSIIAINIITFDVFEMDTIFSIVSGKPCILASEEQQFVQSEFEKMMKQYKNCLFWATPTKMLNYINNSKNKEFVKNINCYIVGGEIITPELLDTVRKYNDSITIYTVYGPTETLIYSTLTDVSKTNDITLGLPIANTQIYIVDKSNAIVPIGATGELCIAGDGVGAGYLNRPELTAEKFIDNPFGDGKLYKTGDLAYWREDGKIAYVGRNDFQVKIRGLRIELGEIESAIDSVEGVSQAVVVVRKNTSGRQLICAFYTEQTPVNIADIKSAILSKLPKYMMPHIFTVLSEMPLTPSGKINRKALPKIDLTNISNDVEFVKPQLEMQKEIAKLMENVLNYSPVGLNDDFFDLGGDSLKAIEFVSKAHSEGIYFNLQAVFDNPTLKGLCEYIENGDKEQISFKDSDFAQINKVLQKNTLDNMIVPTKCEVGNTLFAGATGFLGMHILADFLDNDSGIAYCLVRGADKQAAEERLTNLLEFYFGDKYVNSHRIVVLCSDLQKENFGLSDEEYNELVENVKTVINTAASVKHYGSYKYFYETNVETVKKLIAFCKKADANLIHTSTLSVSGNSFGDEFDGYISDTEKHFYESSLYIEQPLENVYARSKFEAEKTILEEMSTGLKANIMRMGNLTNRFKDAKFQKNHESNAFLNRMKAILDLGIFPEYLMDLYLEFTPIDDAASAVMAIARHFSTEQTVFHINSIKVMYMDKVLECFKKCGIDMKVVDATTFTEVLRNTAKQSGTEYIFEIFINDMDEDDKLNYDSNIRIENDFTVEYLRKLGFEWSDIDFEYIKRYIEYFRNIGYLEV